MAQPSISLAIATPDDLPAMCALYSHHVLCGTGSFEEVPPSIDEITQRWHQRESRHQPTLIARIEGEFAGFAYAASHKERSAYRFTVEDSIYVVPEFTGTGVGYALLEHLIEVCTVRRFEQMIAVIGDSANTGSIALHEKCGFRQIGIATGIGFKFDQWLDVVYMQRALGTAP